MDALKQPRSDAKLKRLSLDVMREVVIRCYTTGVTQQDVLDWLESQHGVKSSAGALSTHLPYLEARVRSSDREQKVQAWLECEALDHPELSEQELFERGQRKFSLLSIAEESTEDWHRVHALRLKQERNEIARLNAETSARNAETAREKLELELKKYQDAIAKVRSEVEKAKTSKGGLTPETLKTIEEAAAIL